MAGSLIISNTTPIINFAAIGRMDVLEAMYGTLVIPPAVKSELEAKADLFPNSASIHKLRHISIEVPADRLLVGSLAARVHDGEAECLALALEHPGSLVLLDDLAARELAVANGILFTGTLGCVAKAKQQGLFPAVEPVLHELRTKARFWISERLAEHILRSVGER